MEEKENPGSSSDSAYNKLVCQEDVNVDEEPLYSKDEKHQVSMSMVGTGSDWNHHCVLIITLAGLAAVLLAVDIGLAVYYRHLTDGPRTVADISREVAKLQATYKNAIQTGHEAKNQLAEELKLQKIAKWELEHQTRISTDYKKKTDKIGMDIATLKSHIPMLKEGCKHCLPGWTYMHSLCYYLPFSDAIQRKFWPEARQFCKKQGGDLAVIDSREKEMDLGTLINNYQDPSRHISQSGFWIGLTDVVEEGTWLWLDGTKLIEGYWGDREPNNMNNEDCAAIYPRVNLFKAWNDAPCNHALKWICEMMTRSDV